jgi:hypothetical protein
MPQVRAPEAGRPYVLIEAQGEADVLALEAAEIVALYKTHGALLLRGFDTSLDAFRRFCAQFCSSSVFNESPDRQLLDAANNIQSVNGGSAPFPLHPELSREPWKPDVCFFCCLHPPSDQGQTTICDGVELVNRLPLHVRRGFEVRRLLYVQPAGPELLAYWLGTPDPNDAQLAAPPAECPYMFRRVGSGRVVRAFTRPALHRPMFTEGPAFGNFLLFARYYIGLPNFPVFADGQPVPDAWVESVRLAGERISVPVGWQKGDLLMLDNTRFMHGRTAITDTRERLIASYFGYLRFAPPNPEEPRDPPWRRGAFRPPRQWQPRRPEAAASPQSR